MRTTIYALSLLAANIASAATPIDGLYATISGGYTYLPDNLRVLRQGILRTDSVYQSGYNAGGSIGYKSNPLRYEGELSYLDVKLKKFRANYIPQTSVRGYNHTILALANVYYDLPEIINSIEPYLGIGIGYAWVKAQFQSAGPNLGATNYNSTNSAFAYQATGGLTFNFAENYALGVGYRYIATEKIKGIGKTMQAHLANLSVTYRFDANSYK